MQQLDFDAKISAPAIFKFHSAEIRAFADEAGEPWFCAADVCAILGYRNARDAVAKHCRIGDVAKRDTPSTSGTQEMVFINEGNLYRLIVKSRKPEAQAFEKKVMEEILPSIRRTGSYESAAALSKAQVGSLYQAMKARFPNGADLPYAWGRFNNHFGLASYKDLPPHHLPEALAYIAQMPDKSPPALPAPPAPAIDFSSLIEPEMNNLMMHIDIAEGHIGMALKAFHRAMHMAKNPPLAAPHLRRV
jgi:prophage antirepressor-like protein